MRCYFQIQCKPIDDYKFNCQVDDSFLNYLVNFSNKIRRNRTGTIPKPNLNPAFTNDQNLPLATNAKTTIILFPSVLNTLVFIKGTIQKSLLDAGINSEVYANIFSQNATLLLKTTNPEFSQQAKRPFRGQLPPLQLLSGKQTVLGIFCYFIEGYRARVIQKTNKRLFKILFTSIFT